MKIGDFLKTLIITLLVALLASGLLAVSLDVMTALAAVGWN
jgi:multidrug efflux pump subunit AcrB